MFDIGFVELLLIAVIGLLVIGPEQLPQVARKLGVWVGRLRRMAGDVQREVDRQLQAEELRERIRKEGEGMKLEEIQGTVTEALEEAKKHDHTKPLQPEKTSPSSQSP